MGLITPDQYGKETFKAEQKREQAKIEAEIIAGVNRKNGYVPVAQQSTFPSLKQFAADVLKDKLPMSWHHELYYDILDDKVIQNPADGLLYPADKMAIKKRNKNIIVKSPRFHAKSQCFTTNYALYELYKNPNARIMIVSANQEIATAFVRQIMNNLENNHDLIDTYGDLKPEDDVKKWGEKAFLVARTSFDKDPSVVGIGAGGKIISRRADIIIVDDLLDIDNARTPTMRKKTLEWFENVLLPVLEDNGRLVVVGTPWYRDDLYDHLMKHPSFDIRLKLKALLYHPKYVRKDKGEVRYIPYKLHEFPQSLDVGTVFSPDLMIKYKLYDRLKAGVLWENKWSFKNLMEKRGQMSMASFMRQYLNEPMSEEEKVFKDETVKEILEQGKAKTLVSSWDNSTDGEEHSFGYGHLIISVGVDLAISKKTTADNSAISVWGMDDRRRRILLWLEYGKWSPDEIKQRVLDVNERFKPVKIVVENVAFQDMLRQDLANDDLPVEGFRTTAGKKFSEETGIAQIAMLMEQNKVLIPIQQSPQDYYARVRQLVYEMSIYTYDQHAGDVLMASWLAFTALNDFDRKMKENRGFFSTTALVEHFRNRRSENKLLLLGINPPVYRYAHNSLVHIYRDVDHPKFMKKMFFEPDEPFMIMVTRKERSVGYILQKLTKEIVGKIEGMSISTIQYATLLEKAGQFFNKAQIVVDKTEEGKALLLELQKRGYDNLLCMQPDEDGNEVLEEGFKISERTLPLAVDHFKYLVDSLHIAVPDEQLLKEMSELISVKGDTMELGYGDGQRIRTVATGLWLLDHYEKEENPVYNGSKQRALKKRNVLKVPYRVFR